MPELPEVETIKRGLNKVIVGKTITGFERRDMKVIQFEPEEVIGSEITEIERRAKILIFHLSRAVISTPQELRVEKSSDHIKISPPPTRMSGSRDGKVLLTHLKMTGQLIWEENAGETAFELKKIRPSTELRTATQRVAGGHPSPDWMAKLPNAYTRAIFRFDDNSVLFFNDLRRFGYMKLYKTADLDLLTELKKLGPDALSDKLTVEYLMRKASKIPNRKIKQFITDQEIISGVGNIYVDEALFYAKISPLRPVREIKLIEWQRIKGSIVKALELGLKYGGSSEDTYVDAFGNQGTMNDHTKVYRHTGAPCPDGCSGTIKRIVVGGRGTHFCPACQI